MTKGEPALAQEIAHCSLIGLARLFVKAQAESRTCPFTVMVGASAALTEIATANRTNGTSLGSDETNFMFYAPKNSRFMGSAKCPFEMFAKLDVIVKRAENRFIIEKH